MQSFVCHNPPRSGKLTQLMAKLTAPGQAPRNEDLFARHGLPAIPVARSFAFAQDKALALSRQGLIWFPEDLGT